ncbi:MAG TPA: hypothetical protein VM266_13730 [Solirubrobacteraceae bacterium]|nr:hypothetical protein [Solirubrobacteraceae bacterium]
MPRIGWRSARRCSAALVVLSALAAPAAAGAATGAGSLRQYSFDWQRLSDRIQVGVNIGTGNLLTEEHDVDASGALGPGLTLARFSNSQTDAARAFGMDSSMDAGADVKLGVQSSGDVDYTGPSAFTVRFTRRADGSFATPSGLDTTLVRQGDGSYVLTEHQSQLARSFTSGGRLTQVEDRNGRKLSYEYNADGTLATITDGPESSRDITRRVTFGYDASRRVNLVTDPAGRQHRYGYDAAGYLSTYTNPDAKVTRYRTDAGRLAVITTPGGRVTKVSYYRQETPTRVGSRR